MRSTDLEHGHAEHAMHMSHGMPPKTAAAHMGHDRHAGHSVAMFRDKFWLTLSGGVALLELTTFTAIPVSQVPDANAIALSPVPVAAR